MSDLRTLPAIRAEAERLARDFLGAADVAFRAAGWDTDLIHGGEDYAEDALRLFAAAHLDLLTDLTRPESRDAVARLVAAKVGLVCGATAPAFYRREPYWLLCAGPQVEDGEEWDGELDFGATPSGDWPRRRIPALVTITDPAEALRLIALHVLRSPDV